MRPQTLEAYWSDRRKCSHRLSRGFRSVVELGAVMQATGDCSAIAGPMNLNCPTTYTDRLHLPALGHVHVNYYGCSALCYQLYQHTHETERQSNIPHLGLISRRYPGSHHTRWEYAALQCALVDLLDRIHKDNPEVGLGTLKCAGNTVQGSELLKSWALLSNFGHCKKTFSDEKVILNALRHSKVRRREYLRAVGTTPLRDDARSVIDSYSYGQFHWSLASVRIGRALGAYSRLKKPLQYLLEIRRVHDPASITNKKKLHQLRRIAELIRKMAIVAIDSRNSHIPIAFDLSSAIVSMDLTEHTFGGESVEGVLNPIIGMLTDLLYADPDVMTMMRDYELQGEAEVVTLTVGQMITRAFDQGIVEPFEARYSHFHRQVIPLTVERSRYEERRRAERLLHGIGPERAQVDDNVNQDRRYLDFLTPNDRTTKTDLGRCIYIACMNLLNVVRFHARDRARAHIDDRDWWRARLDEAEVDARTIERLDMAYVSRMGKYVDLHEIIDRQCAPIVASVVNLILGGPLTLSIDPSEASRSHYGLYIVNDGKVIIDRYSGPMDEVIRRSLDSGRKNEVQLLRDQRIPKKCWFRLACFAPILIMDPTRPPGKRRKTDVDGLIVTGIGKDVCVDIFEAKQPTAGSVRQAKGELRQTVKPLLRSAVVAGGRILGHTRGARLALRFKDVAS